MKNKLVKFGIVSLTVLTLVPSTLGVSVLGFGDTESTVAYAAETRITLGSYTLTKAQTKDLANNMKAIKNNSSLKTVIYGVATKFGGVYGWAGTIAAQLSSNSAYKQVVINAANAGKRVKITVTDSKNYHTSYSTQIKYTAVN